MSGRTLLKNPWWVRMATTSAVLFLHDFPFFSSFLLNLA